MPREATLEEAGESGATLKLLLPFVTEVFDDIVARTKNIIPGAFHFLTRINTRTVSNSRRKIAEKSDTSRFDFRSRPGGTSSVGLFWQRRRCDRRAGFRGR